MPTYSYFCEDCKSDFELFFYIKDYVEKPKCLNCKSSDTIRRYADDILTQGTSIRKLDSELKTIGDLAKRNSDRMSEDEKIHLYQKHNSYKFEQDAKELPTGMNRIKKPPKPKWSKHTNKKQRRKTQNG